MLIKNPSALESYHSEITHHGLPLSGVYLKHSNFKSTPVRQSQFTKPTTIYETLSTANTEIPNNVAYETFQNRFKKPLHRLLWNRIPSPPTSVPPMPYDTQPLDRRSLSSHITSSYSERIPSTLRFFSGLSQPGYAISNPSGTTDHLQAQDETSSQLYSKVEFNNPTPIRGVESEMVTSRIQVPLGQFSQSVFIGLPNKSSPEGQCSSESTTNTTNISSSKEDNVSGSLSGQTLGHLQPSGNYQIYSRSVPSGPLSSDYSCSKFVRGKFSRTGGFLQLEQCNVSLRVPQDCISCETDKEIYLSVCREDRQRPPIKDHQTLLSSTIEFGPSGLQLKEPVLLTFPHCANLAQGAWLIYILAAKSGQSGTISCETENVVPPQTDAQFINRFDCTNDTNPNNDPANDSLVWEVVGQVCRDNGNTGIACQLNSTTVQLVTATPRYYCLVGQHHKIDSYHSTNIRASQQPGNQLNHLSYSLDGKGHHDTVSKFLNIVAFAGPPTPVMNYDIRVYVLPATNDVLEYAKEMEGNIGSRLLDMVEAFPFQNNGTGLIFQIGEVKHGWRSRLQTERQEIPFRHIWSGIRSTMLHCSFSLECTESSLSGVSCTITIQQGLGDGARCTLRLESVCQEGGRLTQKCCN